MGYLLLIAAWIIGVIVPFATGHVIWGIVAVLVPPVAVAIGGFWLVVLAIGLFAAVL